MHQSEIKEILNRETNPEKQIELLISEMTLGEKIGQMSQFAGEGIPSNDLKQAIREGKVGSILNITGVDEINEIQRIALEESRLGIPILIGRDVIHGYQTMMPIPLGQAASWNPKLVEEGARIAAVEAASDGIHWTFAPMVDITRDPRWGRIAESLGEDPYLASELGAAMVRGFQGEDLSAPDRIAACAKHFAGYGYSEAGKDYAYVNISENEMRNVVLPPFEACVKAGVATFMTAFSDINGIPATANKFLLRDVLREEWKFEGFVVSDWDSVVQLITHGFSENEKMAAYEAIQAGLDMEMTSKTYLWHLESLVRDGLVSEASIDRAVQSILRVKMATGLFERPYTDPEAYPEKGNPDHLKVALDAAAASCVLLKNDYQTLPLDPKRLQHVAVIGPLADDGYEQMGTWTFDGVEDWCVTPLQALREALGPEVQLHVAKGLETSRSTNKDGFAEALEAARKSEVVLMFMGEEAILSGEAHSRADIDLPGAQNALMEEISKLGKQTIAVIMAGRPLTLSHTQHLVNSLLYAWHPGTMGGPAIVDILLGKRFPEGKLPVSFPKMVGQVPIYYNQRNSGKPASPHSFTYIDHIPVRAPQTSVGNTSFHLDAGYEPLYPFGYGLSYTHFAYKNLKLNRHVFAPGDTIELSFTLHNTGHHPGVEVAQLYIRDRFGSITRPVRELKGFERVYLDPGESREVQFKLEIHKLAFYGRDHKKRIEPGDFDLWVGGSSRAGMHQSFTVQLNQHPNANQAHEEN